MQTRPNIHSTIPQINQLVMDINNFIGYSPQLLEQLFLATGDIGYIWDLENDRIAWLGNVSNLFRDVQVVTGEQFRIMIETNDLAKREQKLQEHLETGRTIDCEYRLRLSGSAVCWVHERSGMPLNKSLSNKPPDGKNENVLPRNCLVGIIRLATERKQKEIHLESLAHYDPLTGLYSASRLKYYLENMLNEAKTEGRSECYLMVCIDNINMLRRAYGLEITQNLMIHLGRRLKKHLRTADKIGKISDDGYGVLLSSYDTNNIENVCRKIMQMIHQVPFETMVGPIYITVSVGGVVFPDHAATVNMIISKAAQALETARDNRTSTLIMYSPETQKQYDRQQQEEVMIASSVQRALLEQRLRLYFQPIVDANTQKVVFYESLSRMLNPDGTIEPAYRYMPIVEKFGLSRYVDLLTLELVVQELREKSDITLSMNISGSTTLDNNWLERLEELIRHHPQIAPRLIVEITETTPIIDINAANNFVQRMRQLGIRVAIDDFGVGYISFNHIKMIAIDIIKIDGSFVADLATNQYNKVFINTLVGLAKRLHLQTVVEYVEKEEDAKVLRSLGVDYLQGFLFGQPSPVIKEER